MAKDSREAWHDFMQWYSHHSEYVANASVQNQQKFQHDVQVNLVYLVAHLFEDLDSKRFEVDNAFMERLEKIKHNLRGAA